MTPADSTPGSRLFTGFTVLLLTTILSACGGGNAPKVVAPTPAPPSVMDHFAEQKLQWHTCPLDVTGPVLPEVGKKLECAEMTVPLDYQRAEAGTASMAVLRVVASDTPRRRGVLVFNPGGPGGDGLDMPVLFSVLWANADFDNPAGKSFRRIAAEYDLVGFSPRGVGGSTHLVCSSNRVLTAVPDANHDRTDEKLAQLIENARLTAQACQSNPLTPYFNTESTARDLELLRRVLGEQKLNYYGYSYGTWLGKWFESLYPDSVGRMVLDSTAEFPAVFDTVWSNQAIGRQVLLDDIFAAQLAARDEDFGMGATTAQVRSAMRGWNPLVQQLANNELPFGTSVYLQKSLTILAAANGVDKVLSTLADPVNSGTLSGAIDEHEFSSNAQLDGELRIVARDLARWYDGLVAKNTEPLLMQPDISLRQAVVCNDTDSNPDPGFWITLGNELAQRAPFIGGVLTSNPCMFWGGAKVKKPAGDSNAPLLLLQSEFDPLTPTEGALKTFATLPNASMVFVHHEYGHGVFPYNLACVDEPVADYLLGKSPATRRVECQGNRLPVLEASGQPAGRSALSTAADPRPVYGTDPASQDALAAIRESMRRGALDFRPR